VKFSNEPPLGLALPLTTATTNFAAAGVAFDFAAFSKHLINAGYPTTATNASHSATSPTATTAAT
jgi:hypothetical protein